jgi:hypothetical protein
MLKTVKFPTLSAEEKTAFTRAKFDRSAVVANFYQERRLVSASGYFSQNFLSAD